MHCVARAIHTLCGRNIGVHVARFVFEGIFFFAVRRFGAFFSMAGTSVCLYVWVVIVKYDFFLYVVALAHGERRKSMGRVMKML